MSDRTKTNSFTSQFLFFKTKQKAIREQNNNITKQMKEAEKEKAATGDYTRLSTTRITGKRDGAKSRLQIWSRAGVGSSLGPKTQTGLYMESVWSLEVLVGEVKK
ncbi:hypothetical protein Leryth_022087 [Lithospermum erythrorhizon]|nr:hypothetical protein Leryth_022087 [Lithospermum erythrorhizon]